MLSSFLTSDFDARARARPRHEAMASAGQEGGQPGPCFLCSSVPWWYGGPLEMLSGELHRAKIDLAFWFLFEPSGASEPTQTDTIACPGHGPTEQTRASRRAILRATTCITLIPADPLYCYLGRYNVMQKPGSGLWLTPFCSLAEKANAYAPVE